MNEIVYKFIKELELLRDYDKEINTMNQSQNIIEVKKPATVAFREDDHISTSKVPRNTRV